MMFEFETVWPHIKENGLIVSDDIYWNNAFIDFAKKVNSQYTIFDGIGIIKRFLKNHECATMRIDALTKVEKSKSYAYSIGKTKNIAGVYLTILNEF